MKLIKSHTHGKFGKILCEVLLHDHADKYNLIHGKFGKSYAKLPRCTMKLIKVRYMKNSAKIYVKCCPVVHDAADKYSQLHGKFGKNRL